jgi:LemA protein
MKWAVGIIVVLLLLGLILGGSACGTYNNMTTKRNGVEKALSDVDVQLQRRADLIGNLVETVKGYTKHEEKIFTEIAEARSRLLQAKTPDEKDAINSQLSGAKIQVLALAESYPNLKADTQFTSLQDELKGTENRVAVARRDYNGVANDYNTTRDKFPGVLFANLFGFQRVDLFKADPDARQAPKVDFGK